MGRFRIRPECVDDFLALLKEIGIDALTVCDRDDGAVAVEVGEITDLQGRKLAIAFRPEWSAILGIVGAPPFAAKH
ncbi:MAG: hypothetical protein H2054_03255 [Sphingomonas sp.]|uniref:hypothetical protein n=1 Tax=Sphingomonas sp. TaxID=28214 RepID=UPI000DB66F1D|nr:hypothetical protein [Zymomonas sp.]MBA4772114.1 hypothetical protein [Sphingomonas sp.]PZP20065.1 MAG: hypothetical protein DI607_00895 [Sphingomonas hengshuiensis]